MIRKTMKFRENFCFGKQLLCSTIDWLFGRISDKWNEKFFTQFSDNSNENIKSVKHIINSISREMTSFWKIKAKKNFEIKRQNLNTSFCGRLQNHESDEENHWLEKILSTTRLSQIRSAWLWGADKQFLSKPVLSYRFSIKSTANPI